MDPKNPHEKCVYLKSFHFIYLKQGKGKNTSIFFVFNNQEMLITQDFISALKLELDAKYFSHC